jgi:hypothetical protein
MKRSECVGKLCRNSKTEAANPRHLRLFFDLSGRAATHGGSTNLDGLAISVLPVPVHTDRARACNYATPPRESSSTVRFNDGLPAFMAPRHR